MFETGEFERLKFDCTLDACLNPSMLATTCHLDPNHLIMIVFLRDFFEKVNLEKISGQQKHEKSPSI